MASSSARGGLDGILGRPSSPEVFSSPGTGARAVVEYLSLQGFKRCIDVASGDMVRGGHGSAGGLTGFDDLRKL